MKARVLLVAAALLAGAVALAHPPHEGAPGPDMDRMAILLDLNDTQKAEVQRILQEQHEKLRTAHEERRQAGTRPTREERQKFHEQLKQDTIASLQTVLTPDQIKKFEALTDHRHRHGERH